MNEEICGVNVDLRKSSIGFGILKLFQCTLSAFFVIELMIRLKADLSAIDTISITVTVIGALLLIQGARQNKQVSVIIWLVIAVLEILIQFYYFFAHLSDRININSVIITIINILGLALVLRFLFVMRKLEANRART
ncbi:unnamed protein product [Diamesa hyperborea]